MQASLAGVRQLEGEAAALKEAAAERDKAIRAALAQRDAGSHFLHQRTQRCAAFTWAAWIASLQLAGCCGCCGCPTPCSPPAACLPTDCLPACLPACARRLAEVIDEAEARDGEVEELRRKRSEVRFAFCIIKV